jgi:osmotically-inducible protein OsmY
MSPSFCFSERKLWVPHDRIKVTVDNGCVSLEGEVESQHQRSSAEQAVHRLTGLKAIFNQITVKPRLAPTEVKQKIESAFKRSAILDAQRIKVEADGGKVTLSGSVRSWAERDEADRAAWAAPGALEVRNLIAVSS